MSLASGAKLGRYEIRSQIGAGGMGEVYLTQDTRLERTVAFKVLPADVAADQQRMLLEKALADGSAQRIYLNVDPAFDSVPSDPRFADLPRRIVFPP